MMDRRLKNMTSEFIAKYISEPDLIFGNEAKDKDPRRGLDQFGPYQFHDEDSPLESINLGIIGNGTCIDLANQVIEWIKRPVHNTKSNKWLFANYPGMNKESNFACTIKTSKNWNSIISNDMELDKIKNIADPKERIGYTVELYMKKIEKITQNDNQPNVIICTVPEIIEKYCENVKNKKLTPVEMKIEEHKKKNQTFLSTWMPDQVDCEIKKIGFNFRSSLKGKSMEYGVPIQLIRESTMNHMKNEDSLQKEGKQNRATFSWNFSTGLYYKANGKPWRLARLESDTCYIGISFFVYKYSMKKDMHVSMAQVFASTGEGLVIRGTEVDIDEKTKNPYLKKDQAQKILKNALEKYQSLSDKIPTRVVVHKSTMFLEEEQIGFNEAIYGLKIPRKDFVSIHHSYSWINFIRFGNYPVLRGTLVELETNEFLLYTSGYTPQIRSYPGHKIPNPLRIIHIGDSQNEDIAKEILGLTKLNWNTTDFSTSMPITLTFATEVGKILSELEDDTHIQDHYRFFM